MHASSTPSAMITLVAIFALVTGMHGQPPAPSRAIDWTRMRPEILQRYRDLVQLDTTAGHETRAVEYLLVESSPYPFVQDVWEVVTDIAVH